jgi:uncharacterized protein (TIGR00369 family)
VCDPANKRGLGLEFKIVEDGGVEASFDCNRVFEGFPRCLHGGIVSSLLDGAMTNCIFSRGLVAFTAELNVRFLRPVAVGSPATVRAWIDKYSRPLHVVKAQVMQDRRLKATAVGKFMECPELETELEDTKSHEKV